MAFRRTGTSALLALLTLGAFALGTVSARADRLVTDLSQHQVSIRSNFTGTEILLFGAVEAPQAERAVDRDIIVVVTGPTRTVKVRRKEQMAGIWVNHDSVTYPNVPGYHAIASTRPLEVIASPETLREQRIGIENYEFGDAVATGIDGTQEFLPPDTERDFWKALIRNKRRDGLYLTDPGGVIFLGQTLFRATLDLPATVPVGLYTAKVYLLKDGKVVDTISSPLYIDKGGIERFIYRLAYNNALLYGLIAVIGAAFFGWLASAVLGRR
ncbi:TIGR02186 family protein [uncultured Parvibaculum sp.]|uniref:TIGR02186 family protein n=1 Tax=uncultured Parvibaculum sp. TaxID=291828 RepID=UPI0030D741FA